MTTTNNRVSGNSFRNTIKKSVFAAATVVALLSVQFASAKTEDPKSEFQATVFQIKNTQKFRAIAKSLSGKKISIKIKNTDGTVFYKETFSKKEAYNRDFNLAKLEAGNYVFEITDGNTTEIREFVISK